MLRTAVRLAAAALLAAAGLGVPTPARAASCSTAHGVTVVVDFHQLGGGVQAACDAGGAGRTGAQQMADVGHRLVYVQRQPGFVCRVDGVPADDPCVNTPAGNAYWSIWWSDGRSGTWSYSAQGIGSLQVPDGGYVALSWQGGDAKAPPRLAPRAHPSPSPSPTARPSRTTRPTTGATGSPSQAPTSTVPSTAVSSHVAEPSHRPTHRVSSAGTVASHGSPSPDPTAAAAAPERPVEPAEASRSSSGLPGWVPPVLVVVLLGAAAAVAVVRRKRSGRA